jgi:hypothetical protein
LKYVGSEPGVFRILIADSEKEEVRPPTIYASDPSALRWDRDPIPVDKNLSFSVIRHLTTPPKENIQVRIIVLELAQKQ